MPTFSEFLKRARKKLNITQEKAAELIGIERTNFSNYETGAHNPTYPKMMSIIEKLGMKPYEFFSEVPLVPYKNKEPELIFNMPDGEFEGIKLFEDPISLGPGYELNQIVPVDYMPLPKKMLPRGYKSDKDRIVSFPTKGISMKSTINDGSIVWIDRGDVIPKEGEIYAFLLKDLNNAVTIKRLIKIDRHFLIIDGDNRDKEDRKSEDLKDYPMVLNLEEYTQEEISPVRGRVIWVLNRLIEESKKKK